jgi:diacylglycerol kinase family enzyme
MIQFETPYLSGKIVHTVIPEERYFVCCANIGLGATLARKANSGIRRKLGDFLGTLTALIGLLITFKSFPLNINENNTETPFEKLTNLSIGITPYIASGIRVPVHLTESSNEFYKLVAQNLNLFRIIPLLRKVYSGKPFENNSYLSISYSRKLCLYSTKQVEVEADGDPVGHLPCTIRFAEDDLQLLVSR